MRKAVTLAAVAALALSSGLSAQDTGGVYVNSVWEVPKFGAPPTLDGVRGAEEWQGALVLECGVSTILADGAEFGWVDIENQSTVQSVNQLNASEVKSHRPELYAIIEDCLPS